MNNCPAVLETFEPRGANVGEMREYAECVQARYPNESDTPPLVAIGAVFAFFAIALVLIWWLD